MSPDGDEVNEMRKILRTAMATILLTALMVAPATATTNPIDGPGGDDPPCPETTGEAELKVLCPDPVQDGASCRSYGVVIVERDSSGIVGSVALDLSESDAWTEPVPGPEQDPPESAPNNTIPPAPKDPQSHADAQQAGVTYSNPVLLGGIDLEAHEVFSRCDVVALDTPTGLYTEAYGRAGVSDLGLDLPGFGVSIDAEALDYEEHAYGTLDGTWSFEACDVGELDVTPGPKAAWCPPKNAGFSSGTVTVEVHDSWGPTTNAAGQTVYGGAALHVTVSAGPTTVDIYVGYVSVAVTGEDPTSTSVWIPNECRRPQSECLDA